MIRTKSVCSQSSSQSSTSNNFQHSNNLQLFGAEGMSKRLFTADNMHEKEECQLVYKKHCSIPENKEVPEIDKLINILKNLESTEESKIYAVENIKHLIIDDSCLPILINSDIVSNLVTMLAANNTEKSKVSAAILIEKLALFPKIRINIVKYDAVIPYLSNMLFDDNSEKCNTIAAKVLGYLALDFNNMTKITDNVLIIPRLNIMLSSSSEEFRQNAALALGIIAAYPQNIIKICKEEYNVIDKLVEMLLFSNCINSQRVAAIALGHFAIDPQIRTNIGNELLVIPKLINMLINPGLDGESNAAAAFALGKLALNSSFINIICKEAKVISKLVDMLDNNLEKYCENAILTIKIITTFIDEGYKDSFVRAGVFPKLVYLLKNNCTYAKYVLETINNLTTKVIANIEIANEENLKLIIDAGVVPELIKILESDFELAAKIFIKIAMYYPEYKNDMTNELSIFKFINMLAHGKVSNELMILALDAIYWLATGSLENQDKLRKADIVTKLLEILNSNIDYMCKNKAIIVLLAFDKAKFELDMVNKIVEILQSMANSYKLGAPGNFSWLDLIFRAIEEFKEISVR